MKEKMMPRISRSALATIGMTLFLSSAPWGPYLPAAGPPGKPNIILVLTDDMGYGDLACYGGQFAPTPNLDRMAREGVRFTQYYSASPICSPSRTGLTTGMFPGRWQITSYLQTRAPNEFSGPGAALSAATEYNPFQLYQL